MDQPTNNEPNQSQNEPQQQAAQAIEQLTNKLRKTSQSSDASITRASFQTGSKNEKTLLLSQATGERQLIPAIDFPILNDTFAALFNDDTGKMPNPYLDDRTPQYARCRILFELMQDRQYSDSDMRRALKAFAAKQVYPSWKPSDVLDVPEAEPPKLYTYGQYVSDVPKVDQPYFVAYQTSVGAMFGDSRIVGNQLPRVTSVAGDKSTKELPASTGEATARTRAGRRWFLRAMELERKLVERDATIAALRTDLLLAQSALDSVTSRTQ